MLATKTAQKAMTMNEIKQKAKNLGVNPGKMVRVDLIHSIQMAEHCTPCYGKSNGQCPYTGCCFMPDCLKLRL